MLKLKRVSKFYYSKGVIATGFSANNDDDSKAKHYELIQALAEKFKSETGSIICRELLNLEEGPDSPIPTKRTPEYYSERPCEYFVKTAAEIIEKELLK